MILFQAAFQVAMNMLLLKLGPAIFHLKEYGHDRVLMRTIIFNCFVFLQVFNELNCRRIDDGLNIFRGLHKNTSFLLVQVFVIVGQYLIVTFGGVAFKTVPLSWKYWLVCVLIGFLSIPVGIIIRLLPDVGIFTRFFPEEERKPLVSEARMMLESTVDDVRRKLRVFSALRRDMPERLPVTVSKTPSTMAVS